MVTIMTGDCREVLKTLPDASVNCCVTSPPYWGLRDYGTGTWQGGDAKCEHVVGEMRRGLGLRYSPANTRGGAIKCAQVEDIKAREQCPKCGAVRSDQQIGLERTPAEYVETLVEVFREVWRILRDDGTLWLNLGDSFASGKGTCLNPGGNTSSFNVHLKEANVHPLDRGNKSTLAAVGLKPKDLVGIPWRMAFALQADGWYLRQDIIWHKPNPMPESVTDRCTKAHEYIFLLTKSARYYYDAEAIKEPVTQSRIERLNQPNLENQKGSTRVPGKTNGPMKAVCGSTGVGWNYSSKCDPTDNRKHRARSKREGPNSGMHVSRMAGREDSKPYPSKSALRDPDGDKIHGNIPGRSDGGAACNDPSQLFRNKRSVWTVTTQSFKDAHFATFPPALITPCILAGCSAQVCAKCGAPQERIVKKSGGSIGHGSWTCHDEKDAERGMVQNQTPSKAKTTDGTYRVETIGFGPTCSCNTGTVSGTVLDPFGGSGTVGEVAEVYGRNSILIELNAEYVKMAKRRTAQGGLFCRAAK